MDRSERKTVGVLVERRRLDSPWVDASWRPVVIVPEQPQLAPWTVLEEAGGTTLFHAGPAEIALFPSEAENYKHNLDSGRPSIYVVLRRDAGEPGMRLLLATVDPGEVDTHSDAGDDLIEALPLPAPLVLWMERFVARHYVPRPFHKRRRDRADTEALARRRPDGAAPQETPHGRA